MEFRPVKIEIEAKVRVAAVEPVQQRLEELDARFVARMLETNIFVDSDQRRLMTADRGLRVREVRCDDGQTRITITYKGPRLHRRLKSRREIELSIDSVEAGLALFGELGYHEVIRFEKQRQRYQLDGCTIELDRVPHLGSFVEIEGPDDRTVEQVRERLGLGDRPLVSSSYVAMLRTYLQEQAIAARDIRFEPEATPAKVR